MWLHFGLPHFSHPQETIQIGSRSSFGCPRKNAICYFIHKIHFGYGSRIRFLHIFPPKPCGFFPSQAPFVLAYFLLSSAQRWLVEIRKPSSYLDTEQGSFTPWVHGAVWSKAATMSFSTKVTRNNHQQSKAKHKIMFNWNRVIVCTHSRISRWPPVYLLSLRFTAYPFEACWAAHLTRK